ncbi:hypothetical protein EPN18_05770 [bacterium]|nr:MAG: hypothetical protein EPN18_05770 [bacterium]
MKSRFFLQRLALLVASGIVWGWLSMAINSFTGAFTFESGLSHNFISFALGGVILSLICAGFLFMLEGRLPFKRTLPKAVLVSASVWLVLRIGGAFLSAMDSERFHVVTPQTLQGFLLAIVLGVVLGIVWGLTNGNAGYGRKAVI